MALEVKIDVKEYPKDYEFDVGGLLLQNGKTKKLTDDEEAAFVARNRQAVREALANNENITVSGSGKFTAKNVEDTYPAPEALVGENPYVTAPQEDTPATEKEGGES